MPFYGPQRSWAKVIFSEACVKKSVHRGRGFSKFSGGGGLVRGGSPNFRGGGLQFSGAPIFLEGVSNFSGGLQFWGGVSKFSNFRQPPPPDTVNEWPVHILLECILVP